MAVAIQRVTNKSRLFQALLNKWGHPNLKSLISRISQQTGVADDGGDLTITNTLAGDIILDVDNDDWYIVTTAAITTATLHA